jgi:hypothetical protein
MVESVIAVDPDSSPASWPVELRRAAEAYASQATIAADDDLAELLGARPLRAYHATRLLPREEVEVRSTGLKALDAGHVEGRLAGAYADGSVSLEQYETLLDRQVFSENSLLHDQVPNRQGRVCLVVGLAALNPWGLSWPLESWGGEAIYRVAGDLADHLGSIGRPGIVVVDLDLSSGVSMFTAGPVIAVFASKLSGEEGGDAEVHWRGSVPASSIVDLWHPGSPEYDMLPGLPDS